MTNKLSRIAVGAAEQAKGDLRTLRANAVKFLQDLKAVVDTTEDFNDPYVFRRAINLMGASFLKGNMGDVTLDEQQSGDDIENEIIEIRSAANRILGFIDAVSMGEGQEGYYDYKYIVAVMLNTQGKIDVLIRICDDYEGILVDVAAGDTAYRVGQRDLPDLEEE